MIPDDMRSEPQQSELEPFPLTAFSWLAIAWILFDLVGHFFIFSFIFEAWIHGIISLLMTATLAALGAKLSLASSWLVLSDRPIGQKLLYTLAVFAPLLLSICIIETPWALLAVLCSSVFVAPLMMLPFALLSAGGFVLQHQSSPHVDHQSRQFSIRQLFFATLLAAVVMAVLRAFKSDQLIGSASAVLSVIIAYWLYPIVIGFAILGKHWYPVSLYGAALSAYLLFLPLCTQDLADAAFSVAAVVAFMAIYTGHLLLLRWLGFRLNKSTLSMRRRMMLRENRVQFTIN